MNYEDLKPYLTVTATDYEKMITAPSQFDSDWLGRMIKSRYDEEIYQVKYINEILRILDENASEFTISKTLSGDFTQPVYRIVINQKLVLKVDLEDIFNIHEIGFHINGKREIYTDLMLVEAREKIESKYIQWISRMEDASKRSIYELLQLNNG